MSTGLRVLGSGTLLPDAAHHSASHYLHSADTRILLDCGPGTLHSFRAFDVPWEDLSHVALSHFHTDHIGDLPALFFALKHGRDEPRSRPLVVFGPEGLRRRFGHMAGAFGDHILDPGFEVVLVELELGAWWEDPRGAFRLAAHATPHTDESLAYRWEGSGVSVGYTGDTGPSQQVAEFLSDCELVVTECALDDPPSNSIHLSPTGVAKMAEVMQPELLLLTHIYPPQTPDSAAAAVRAAGWQGSVVGARDGTRVQVEPGAVQAIHPGTPPLEQGPPIPTDG